MLKIRMQRTGRINRPSYRVVVVEHTASPKVGKVVESVGNYDPATKKRELNAERITYWISVGAQPSDTMHNMLLSAGIISGKKINVLPKKTVEKKEEPVAEVVAPAVEAPVEAPTEDAPTSSEEKAPEVTEEAPAEVVEEAPAEAPVEVAEEAPTETEASTEEAAA